jgi:hypothetical protein
LPIEDMAGRGWRRADAAAEWWRELRPGQYLEVDYEDDAVSHERLALWPATARTWAVRSPNGDEWIEDLSGADPWPLRRRGAGPPLYRFRA